MKIFGLAGDPITGSLSPELFNAGYHGKYRYDLIEGDDFDSTWKTFLDNYSGINITSPFKEKAFGKADLYTSYCNKIGAANIVVKTEDGILADNSDFTGIVLSIAEAYIPGLVKEMYGKYGSKGHIKAHQFFRHAVDQLFTRKPQALVIGCGGAGRAAAVAAAELGFDTALMNRTEEKARKIAEELPEYNFIVDKMSDFRPALRECDLIIYTLPVGIEEIKELEAKDFEGEDRYTWPRPAKVILEANYKTPAFAASEEMKLGGCQYVSGLRWLMYQALTGYTRLTGEDPDLEAMERVMTNR